MSVRSWIRKLFDLRSGSRTHERRRPRPLAVDILEDRLAPANFVVTSTSDAAPPGAITLRFAVEHLDSGSAANTNTITFAPSIAGQTIVLTNGELDLSHGVTIGQTGGVAITISGGFASRIFNIPSGSHVIINNITMEDGVASGRENTNGGAILNGGNLTLVQSTVTGSTAIGATPNGFYDGFHDQGAGGGIYNGDGATLNLMQSTISGNTAQGGPGGVSQNGGGSGGGGAGMGGGIYSSNNSTVKIVDSTISGNAAIGGAGANDYEFVTGSSNGFVGRGGGNSVLGGINGFGGGGAGGFTSGSIDYVGGGWSGGFGGGGGGGGAFTSIGIFSNGFNGGAGGPAGTYGGQGSPGGYVPRTGHYTGAGGGGAGMGGGIFSRGGSLTITASTIGGNVSRGGLGGRRVFENDNGATSVSSAGGGAGVAGGVFVYSGTATLNSTIIADNTATGYISSPSTFALGDQPAPRGLNNDAHGTFSGSFNLVEDASGVSGLTIGQNPLVGQNPNLLALADNGGPTATMAITSGPALQGGNPNLTNPIDGTPLTVDQRGVLRESPPDIGAYQFFTPSTITVSAGAPVTLGSGQTLTASATLSAGFAPTGTITFTLFYNKPGVTPLEVDSETVSVDGNGSYSTPDGYTFPTTGSVTGLYQWNVKYGGDTADSSATDNNDPAGIVQVSAAAPTLTASPSASIVTLGSTPVTLTDMATLAGGYHERGSLTFTLVRLLQGSVVQVYQSNVTVNGDGFYAPTGYTPPTFGLIAGTYQWQVTYQGDGNNSNASFINATSNQVTIQAASPVLTGTPNATSVTLGPAVAPLTDTAILAGGFHPTGTIVFSLLYNGSQVFTKQMNVNGNGAYTVSPGYSLPATAATGTYQWNIAYNNLTDTNNNGISVLNDARNQVSVQAASPTLFAVPNLTSVALSGGPVTLQDTAFLQNGFNPDGVIKFNLVSLATGATVYTDAVDVNGNGAYSTTIGYQPSSAGTFQWNATYIPGGTGNNSGPVAYLNAANEQVVVGAAPQFTQDQTSLSLGIATYGAAGRAASYKVSAGFLTAPVTLTAPTGVELSTDGASWFTSLTLSPSNGSLAPTLVDVRISAGANAGSIMGDIVETSSGVATQTVFVSGLVNPRALGVSIVNDPSKPYDGSTSATLTPANYLITGLFGSDNFTITQSVGAYNGKHVDTATSVTVHLSGADFSASSGTDPNNYVFPTTASGAGSITPAGLSASIVKELTKTYDGTTSATLASNDYQINGLIGGDNFAITQTVGVFNSKDGDTATSVTATLGSANFSAVGNTDPRDYAFPVTVSGQGVITPASLTASIANDPTKTYDGTTAATLAPADYHIAGLFGADNFTVTQTVGAYNNKNVVGATSITVDLSSGDFSPVGNTDANDYSFPTIASGAGSIAPANLAYTANPVSRTYGKANPALTGTVTGVVPSDTLAAVVSGKATFTTPAIVTSNVGSYPINGTGLTLLSTNYVLVQAAGNSTALTVTPATLTVALIGTPTKTYDGTTTAKLTSANFQITGLLFGDKFSVTQATGVYNSKDVATATTVTATLDSSDLSPVGKSQIANYAIPASVSGKGKITPAALTVSIVGAPSKTFNGTIAATLNAANFQINGVGAGDSFTINQTVGAYNSTNVVSATTVTASLAKANFSAAQGTLTGNYTFPTRATGNGTITPARLSVSIIGNPTKAYDGTTTAKLCATNYSVTGLVGTNAFTVTKSAGTYDSKNVLSASTINVNLAFGNFAPAKGTLASNYAFPATASGRGQIKSATLVYHIGNDAQNQGTPADLAHDLPTIIKTGVNNENLAITYSSPGAIATANPGKYAITGASTDGTGLASNYSVTLIPGVLTINAPVQLLAMTLPMCTVLTPYNAHLSTSGGTGPLTFVLSNGSSLPAGLKLSASGVISGLCSVAGTFTFTVTVTDSLGETATQMFSLTAKTGIGNL